MFEEGLFVPRSSRPCSDIGPNLYCSAMLSQVIRDYTMSMCTFKAGDTEGEMLFPPHDALKQTLPIIVFWQNTSQDLNFSEATVIQTQKCQNNSQRTEL